MTDEQKRKCRGILDYYGRTAQLRQLIEECAELIQAAAKFNRVTNDGEKQNLIAYQHLCEELADVMIMTEQIRQSVNDSMVQAYINAKLDRQLGRINNEKATRNP
jgi:NTP pyrophosphatase (non-canonical NTP hydrolase)